MLAAVAWLLAPPGALAAAEPDAVRLQGHVLPALADATRIARPSRADEIVLTFVLRRSDQPGFDRYLTEVYDPSSPSHRGFLRQQELAARFGPSSETYEALRRHLERGGLDLVRGSTNRLTLTVRGTRAAVEHLLAVRIDDYRLAGEVFHANDRDPALPAALAASVASVSGLSSAAHPQHANVEQLLAAIAAACAAGIGVAAFLLWTAPLLGFLGAAIGIVLICLGLGLLGLASDPLDTLSPLSATRQAYGVRASSADASGLQLSRFGVGLVPGATGAGQTVGLVQFDTFRRSDVEDYLALVGAPASMIDQVSEVPVNGGVATPGPGESEVLLDIVTVLSLAPAANVVVYSAPFDGRATSYSAIFNAMVDDEVDVISNSWSSCENEVSQAEAQAIDLVLQSAAASGISVFNASGDTGSTCLNGSPNTVGVPAGSPSATAVGGTSTFPADGPSYGSEAWWSGLTHQPPTGEGGFGVSRHFARPSYQDGLTSATGRSVPDVVAPSDPERGQIICQASNGGCPNGLIYGGTSMAAPQWAGLTALLNERLGANLGALNAQLYTLAGSDAFNDAGALGSDFARVGLGSPNPSLLHLRLSGEGLGPVDAAASRVLPLAPASVLTTGSAEIPADGTTPGGILVRLVDAGGYPVGGKTVTLEASSSNVEITPPSGVTTVANGTVAFRVTSVTPEPVTFVATNVTDGVELSETTDVTFAVPPAAGGSIAAFPSSVAANGVSTTTITVTLKDALDRPTPGKRVDLAQGAGHSVIVGPNPPVTDTNGMIMFTATNGVNETVTYTARDVSDGNLPIPGSAQVTFTGASTSCVDPDPPLGENGYLVTPFANGFFAENFFFGGVNWGGCPGASMPAFRGPDVYIANFRTGALYQFDVDGGAVSSAGILATHGPAFGAPVVGKDGRLYASFGATASGGFFAGSVVEIDPGSGAIVRTLAANQRCPIGLAIDPLSGDLFFAHSCFGAGSDDPTIKRVRDPGGPSPTVEVYATLPGTPNGIITFAPDGTLYVAGNYLLGTPPVYRVDGTDVAGPPGVAQVPGVTTIFNLTLGETGPDGEALSLLGSTATGIELFDLRTDPPARTIIARELPTGVIGPDGCLYSSRSDTVYKVTRDDGGCSFRPTSALPALALTPAAVTTNPLQGATQELGAAFLNVAVPDGTPVFFEVTGANPTAKMVRTDAAGEAPFAYVGVYVGDDVVVATATVGSEQLVSNPVRITWAAGRHVTFLTLDPRARGGTTGEPLVVRATLTDVSAQPPVPAVGVTVVLALGGGQCSAVTDASGRAECSLVPDEPGISTLTATFAGTAELAPASKSVAFLVADGVALDRFMTYRVKATKGAPKLVKLGPVVLGDGFGEAGYDVLRPLDLALPASQDGGGMADPATHLSAYAVKRARGSAKFAPQKDVRVLNQCGEVVVTLRKPASLLVPTAKDLGAPVEPPDPAEHEVDHFLCYDAATQKKTSDGTRLPGFTKGVQVEVADQLQSRRYDLKRIKWLCAPASKSGTPLLLAGPQKGTPFPLEPAAVRNPDEHLLCYQAVPATRRIEQDGCGPASPRDRGMVISPKQEKHARRLGVHVANQLQASRIDTTRESLFCLPSTLASD